MKSGQVSPRRLRPASLSARKFAKFATASTARGPRSKPLRSAFPKRGAPGSICPRQNAAKKVRGGAPSTRMMWDRADGKPIGDLVSLARLRGCCNRSLATRLPIERWRAMRVRQLPGAPRRLDRPPHARRHARRVRQRAPKPRKKRLARGPGAQGSAENDAIVDYPVPLRPFRPSAPNCRSRDRVSEAGIKRHQSACSDRSQAGHATDRRGGADCPSGSAEGPLK